MQEIPIEWSSKIGALGFEGLWYEPFLLLPGSGISQRWPEYPSSLKGAHLLDRLSRRV